MNKTKRKIQKMIKSLSEGGVIWDVIGSHSVVLTL